MSRAPMEPVDWIIFAYVVVVFAVGFGAGYWIGS